MKIKYIQDNPDYGIKITVKKSEIEYCFKADNVEELEKRFDALKEIIRQRLINEISKRDIKSMCEYIINSNRGDIND